MLPIKLELSGINSFKTEQVIDFSSLGEGFFGIFGATGSGKSTILDAITLSLYGKIQRAKTAYDFINLSKENAFVRFCFSTVVDGKENVYLIERNFKRKKDSKQVESGAVLYKKQDNSFVVVAEGVFSCDNMVKSILGLGIDEFSKCIALPQGQFADFLKSTPNERTGLISNVFNLQSFGAPLYECAKEKEGAIKVSVAELVGKLAELGDVSSEGLKDLQSELNLRLESLKEIQEEIKRDTQKFDLSKQTYLKQVQLQKAQDRAQMLEQDSANMTSLEERLETIKKAEPLLEELEGLTANAISVKQLEAQLGEVKNELVEVEKEYELAKDEFEQENLGYNENYNSILTLIHSLNDLKQTEIEVNGLAEQKSTLSNEISSLKNTKAEFEEKKVRLESEVSQVNLKSEKASQVIADLKVENGVVAQIKKGVELQSQIEVINKIANSFDEYVKELRAKKSDFEAKIEKCEENINGFREDLNSKLNMFFDQNTTKMLKNNKNEAENAILELKNAKTVLETIDNLTLSFKKGKEEKLEKLNALEEKQNQSVKKVERAKEEVTVAKKQYQEISRKRENGLSDLGVFMLYKKAQPLERCPVCNNIIEGKINEAEFAQEVPKEQVNEAYDNIFRANENLTQALSASEQSKAMVDALIEQIKFDEENIALLEQKYNAMLEKFVSPYENETIDDKLEKNRKISEENEELLQKIAEFENLQQEDTLNLAEFRGALAQIEGCIEDALKQTSELYQLKNERKQIINNLESRFGGQNIYSINNLIDINLEKLEKEQKDYDALQKNKQEMEVEISLLASKISELETAINLKTQRFDEIVKLLQAKQQQIRQFDAEGVGTQKLIEINEAKLKQLQNTHIELEKKQSNLFLKKANKESEVKLVLAKFNEKQAVFQKSNLAFDEKMKNCGFSDVSALKEYKTSEESKLEIVEKLQNYVSAKGLVRAEIEQLQSELEGVMINASEMAELELIIESNKAVVEDLTIKIGKLQGEIERVEEKLVSKNEICSKLEKLNADLACASELVRVLRGKALAQFVCDEYLQDITIRANQIIQILLDGKFTLKFENGEFLVEDNLNGGAVRVVSTLSGGETFLISLSLALSISETIAAMNGKNMDFFFLDEGFGTLDSDLCETVTTALYRLEENHLRIGVISHVELLYEKIKNKIIVTKTEEGGSKVRVELGL